jgi:hypothetical protein
VHLHCVRLLICPTPAAQILLYTFDLSGVGNRQFRVVKHSARPVAQPDAQAAFPLGSFHSRAHQRPAMPTTIAALKASEITARQPPLSRSWCGS